MQKDELIRYWLDSAERDLETADHLFASKDYAWSLFIGHLVVEKTLKAILIRDTDQGMPPKIHNLLRIAEETKLALSEEQKLLLLDINDFNIEARYPDFKQEFHKRCDEHFSREQLAKIKDLYTWLRRQI